VRFIRESAQHKATPLIIISTDGREADRDRGMKLGADAYLTKPFAPELLIETVRSVLKA
jgi:two-component system chemotaxis response regulator CheY